MYNYSKHSQRKLNTCHNDLQKLFLEVGKYHDCTIMFGHRTPTHQYKLYKIGREIIDGVWRIKDYRKIITFKDGTNNKSDHNYFPSMAADVVAYPIKWDNEDRDMYFANCVMEIAEDLNIKIEWGGNWKWKDPPHYKLILPDNTCEDMKRFNKIGILGKE